MKQEVKQEIKEEIKVEIKEEIKFEDLDADDIKRLIKSKNSGIQIIIKFTKRCTNLIRNFFDFFLYAEEPEDSESEDTKVVEKLEKVEISEKEKNHPFVDDIKFMKGKYLYNLPLFLWIYFMRGLRIFRFSL